MQKLLTIACMTVSLSLVARAQSGEWVTLFDGTHLNNFNQVGTANWTLANGIVEMQLPEDRIVNLAAVRRADGSVAVGHVDLDAADAHVHVAPKQEVAGE